MTDRFTTKGFADYLREQRGHTNTFLDRIDVSYRLKKIERVLGKHYRKTASADGRPAYPALPMFKLLLLQRWYGARSRVRGSGQRISFIRFSGFSVSVRFPITLPSAGSGMPFLELNLFERLFEEINRQLEEQRDSGTGIERGHCRCHHH